ncbi:hypothetical protein GL279_07405 [Paracoccus limosus]|jgi:hypothetical protein|uniref:HTH merR-type domain-containing protein n=1 Tax=Paracoccus limosus TaxID=913252 RepID=A0A844H0Q0_9RHOB|nr:hypothetical protein [Paracoccus limosus]MTH34422.1 hypothetical protein [Paracoccus limosus]
MSIFHQQFANSEIVAATGVTNYQLQNWLKRGQIIGQGVEGGGSPGKHRRFSFFNLMEIAVSKALIDTGLTDMQRVTEAAAGFAHTGNGAIGDRPGRQPGFPFKDGKTMLIVGPERSAEYQIGLSDHPLGLLAAIKEHGIGAIVIDVSEVFSVTLRRAGLDPVAALNEAYNG